MNIKRRDVIRSEVSEIESILARIPPENVIDRFGLEARLGELNLELAALGDRVQDAERLQLTFRGQPVLGSRAIAADFAGAASSAFVDAFSAIIAGLKGSLRYSGPIPDKVSSRLMITGMATGSYGFEMELPAFQSDLFAESATPGDAAQLLRELLRVSATGSDDDISDIVEAIHPRAVRKVADFLSVVSKKGAWCGLEFRNEYFKFDNLDQLKNSEYRLRSENIIEGEEVYFGEFQGILPKGRTFEFVLSDDSDVIRGRLGLDIGDPDILNREWLHKPIKVKFSYVQVGQSRPRYSVEKLEDIGLS